MKSIFSSIAGACVAITLSFNTNDADDPSSHTQNIGKTWDEITSPKGGNIPTNYNLEINQAILAAIVNDPANREPNKNSLTSDISGKMTEVTLAEANSHASVQITVKDDQETVISYCSGALIISNDYKTDNGDPLLLTSGHCFFKLEEETNKVIAPHDIRNMSISAQYYDENYEKQTYRATINRADIIYTNTRDIAIATLDTPLPDALVPNTVSFQKPQIGDTITAEGHAGDKEGLHQDDGKIVNFISSTRIKTSAGISQGSSGGAVKDNGIVIGVNSAFETDTRWSQHDLVTRDLFESSLLIRSENKDETHLRDCFEVNATNLNIRTGPGTKFGKKGMAHTHDVFYSMGMVNQNWATIQLHDKSVGYVSSKYVEPSLCY